jgi:osmotically inducible lipoprotein OsmB
MNSNYEKECAMKRKFLAVAICVLFIMPLLLAGCAGMTPTQKGAVGGAGVGAVAGGLAGGSAKGALIGAGVGALGGALLNDAAHKNK